MWSLRRHPRNPYPEVSRDPAFDIPCPDRYARLKSAVGTRPGPVRGAPTLRSAGASWRVRSVVLVLSLTLMRCIGLPEAAMDDAMTKVSPELRSLYEAYRAALQTGAPLVSTHPLVPIVDGRVIIDAVASGDVEDLKQDLIALGLDHAASAGRIVSGRLPVAAIPAMAALPSLRFARAAMAMNQGGGGPSVR